MSSDVPLLTKADRDDLKGKGDETERENKESPSRCDLHEHSPAPTGLPCVGHQPGYRGLVNRMM